MQSFHIYKNLAWLNDLPVDQAKSAFLDCCGSTEWARRMALARPFPLVEKLCETAESTWFSLSPADWLEAFASHPKIGSKKTPSIQKARAAEWSSSEQSGVNAAANTVRNELDEANRLYQDKFGFIFIVCATGKSADEMLAIARARLGNSAETEMRIAAEEQLRITQIRLNKLLEK